MPSKTRSMTKEQKIQLYLDMSEETAIGTTDGSEDIKLEIAVADAGRIYKNAPATRASSNRSLFLAFAALGALALLMTACAWSGLAMKVIRGAESLFSGIGIVSVKHIPKTAPIDVVPQENEETDGVNEESPFEKAANAFLSVRSPNMDALSQNNDSLFQKMSDRETAYMEGDAKKILDLNAAIEEILISIEGINEEAEGSAGEETIFISAMRDAVEPNTEEQKDIERVINAAEEAYSKDLELSIVIKKEIAQSRELSVLYEGYANGSVDKEKFESSIAGLADIVRSQEEIEIILAGERAVAVKAFSELLSKISE